jgi:DNA replication and repair protein RecF
MLVWAVGVPLGHGVGPWAISLLSPGRGLRRAVYAEAVKAGTEAGFAIFAQIEAIRCG